MPDGTGGMQTERPPAVTSGKARTRDGVTLHYRLAGSNAGGRDVPRVVLIHSLAMDSSVWDAVVPRLTPSAEVLTLDCRGHGKSQKTPGPYTIEMFGDDVADVMDRVGWSDAVVAGCSMGGCVAQAFAARHPGRVRGLVLIDTTAWYGADALAAWRKRADTARAEGLASMGPFQATRWFGDAFREKNAQLVKDRMDVFVRNDIECYAATCVMLGDADLRAHLAKFSFPTSVVVGEEDYATPVEAARALQQSVKGATLRIIPGARHLTPIEVPEIIADEILVRVSSHAS